MIQDPKDVYDRLLPVLRPLEAERAEAARMVMRNFLISGIIGAALVATALSFRLEDPLDYSSIVGMVFGGLMGGLVIGIMVANLFMKGDVTHVKVEFFGKLIPTLAPNLFYSPKSSFTLMEVNQTRLFWEHANIFHTRDMIYGTIGEASVRFAQISVAVREKKAMLTRGESDTPYSLFNGLFYEIEPGVPIDGRTYVIPKLPYNKWEKRIAGRFDKNARKRGSRIKLNDPKFNQYFEVFGTDSEEARTLLSPAVTRALLECRLETQRLVYVNFQNDKVYLAINGSEKFLDLDIEKSFLKPETFEAHFKELSQAVTPASHLVDALRATLAGKEPLQEADPFNA